MQLSINGELKTVSDSISVAALIGLLELKRERVAVELNCDIVPRARWEQVCLRSGDRLEIVHFVGGG